LGGYGTQGYTRYRYERKMLKNENIICISSIDWDFVWQGHQEIMSTFAKNGNRILFIENTGVRMPGIRDISRIKKRIKNWFKGVKGIRKEMENLYIFSPLVLPFPYSRIARWINRYLILSVLERWMITINFADPIMWTFLPTPLSADIIDSLSKKLVVYYCIDNFSVSSVSAKKIKRSEIKLLKKADLVFVTSSALRDYCAQYNNKIFTFPFAVDFEEFEQVRLKGSKAVSELADIKRPIIGYVGGVHKWIDQKLVKALAQKRNNYSFVFVGPVQTDISLLSGIKNIYFMGNKKHEELPYFIKQFDLCTIPYLLTAYTKNVYPTKLNEYLAMGKAVISTDLPEVATFNRDYGNVVYVSDSAKGFGDNIDKAISEDNAAIINRRIEVARENSWGSRIEKMNALIGGEIEKKKLGVEARWKENMFIFYKTARKKLIRLGAICLLAYLILFKTSFIWFLAGPLKIEDRPVTSDVIVVFAGGVGESGKAGQGYEERVQHAVELHKKGFAKKIIFSTGYKYALREAEVMKALAVSMGVSSRDILLEGKARNTYENVKFTKGILDKHDWRSILFVSSPYHMRRSQLVFRKISPEKKIIFSPIPDSLFYMHGNNAELHQIRAVIHEYIGIVYYWFKGHI